MLAMTVPTNERRGPKLASGVSTLTRFPFRFTLRQVKNARVYRMRARAASTDATRARIRHAALELFLSRWYDEVTLAEVADAAGVTVQTVRNHFGSKDGLLTEAGEEMRARVQRQRDVAPGDVDAAVAAVARDYEQTGDGMVRLLALEARVPALAPRLAEGRAWHRDWVRRTFGASEEALPMLVVATDVYTWKLLRRDQALGPAETEAAMRRLVRSILHAGAEA
jgi:AcrR family transcriptional regulator